MKIIFTTLLALGLSISLHSQAAFTIDLTPDSQHINVGEDLVLKVQVSGLNLNSPPSLADYDVNINYDANLFTLNNVVWGDLVQGDQLNLSGFGSLFGSDSPSAGVLHFFQVSFDSPSLLESLQSDSFTLFNLIFSSITTGSADFSLTANAIGDAYGNNLVPANISSTAVVVQEPASPVPLPGGAVLFASALFGFFRYCRSVSVVTGWH